jgi:hypothetical protein
MFGLVIVKLMRSFISGFQTLNRLCSATVDSACNGCNPQELNAGSPRICYSPHFSAWQKICITPYEYVSATLILFSTSNWVSINFCYLPNYPSNGILGHGTPRNCRRELYIDEQGHRDSNNGWSTKRQLTEIRRVGLVPIELSGRIQIL